MNRPTDLAVQAEANLQAVRDLVTKLREPDDVHSDRKGPVWVGVAADTALEFLSNYRVDDQVGGLSIPLIRAYIERLRDRGELTAWTIAVRGRDTRDEILGETDWGIPDGRTVFQVRRSRLGHTESVGVITSPGDEMCGLTDDMKEDARAVVAAAAAAGRKKSENAAARELRPATNGLILLYPISRYSGHDLREGGRRRPLYDNPQGPLSRDLVGLAISFPKSNQPQQVEAYMIGSAGWVPNP